MNDLIGDEPKYEVVQVTGISARVQIYHERAVIFKTHRQNGILKDIDLRSEDVGYHRDGKINTPIRNKARTMARIAMNKVRRKSKFYKT